MLIAKDLPIRLWAKAVQHMAYIGNHVRMCALNDVTPEEAWTGDKQDISHLHKFGTRLYVLNEGDHLKLYSKAMENIFVGFEDSPM